MVSCQLRVLFQLPAGRILVGMTRLLIPETIATSPAASQPLLAAIEKQLGSVPNLFRLLGTSPAALEGYLGLSGALGKGTLDLKTRQRLAIVVAEANGCDYCLAAHTYLGKHLAKLDDHELAAARDAHAGDAKAAAALRFARAVTLARGKITPSDLAAVKAAGYTDAQVVEIVMHVALNTLTNYTNNVAETAVDFPAVVR